MSEYPLFNESNVRDTHEKTENFIPLMPTGDLRKYINYESSGDESFSDMNPNKEYAELKTDVPLAPHQNYSIEQLKIQRRLNDIKAEVLQSNHEQLHQILKSSELEIDPTALSTAIKQCIEHTMKTFLEKYELRPKRQQHQSNRAHETKRSKSDDIHEEMASRSNTSFDEYSILSSKSDCSSE